MRGIFPRHPVKGDWVVVDKLVAFYKNRRNTVWILGAVFISVVVFAAFRLTQRTEVQYFTAEVTRGDIVQIVNATGSIDAVTTVEVGSQVSGLISSLSADFNSVVREGDVIARIDPEPLKARRLQVEADLASARANLRGLEADRAVARANLVKVRAALREAGLNLGRSKELLTQGITSSQQHESAEVAQETAQANLEAAEAQILQLDSREEQAEAQIRQRQAQLQQARLDLDHTIIRAPIDGTVIARNVDVGQTVAASLSAPTLFTIAQDLTKMLVYAKTDESDVGKIRQSADVTFVVDAFPGENFQGRILQVRMNPTTIQNVVTYDTVIEFDNPDGRLLPGMTAYVTIPVGDSRDVVKIPNGALRFTPDLSEEHLQALLVKYELKSKPGPPREKKAESDNESADAKKDGSGESGARMRERFQNMSPAERARMRQQFAGRRQHQGGGRRPAPPSVKWQRVWKVTADNNLVPMDIQTGLTDYTFTALIKGVLEEGEELVIGQTGGGNSRGTPSLRRAMRRF